MERRRFGFPPASHPADQEPTTHAEVGTGPRARTWNYALNITSIDPPFVWFTHNMRPRVARREGGASWHAIGSAPAPAIVVKQYCRRPLLLVLRSGRIDGVERRPLPPWQQRRWLAFFDRESSAKVRSFCEYLADDRGTHGLLARVRSRLLVDPRR
jgi:hypothetical protein